MNYHNITKDDMLNGDGLRVVLWIAGCTHNCQQCHNPITWDVEGGLTFDETAKNEIYQQLDKSYISGITFSGGDPLHPANREAVTDVIKEIKQKYPTKTIWLYTGFVWEEIAHLPMVPMIDVLVDGPFMIEQHNDKLHWRGSNNQRVIDAKKTLTAGKVMLHCE